MLASSTIIEDIETIHRSGLAILAMYFYDFREDQKKDLRGLLSSVLFQLCDQSDSYYDVLSTFYLTHRNGAQSPSDEELVRCLKDLLKLPGQAPVYLVVDALDECPNTSALSSPREEVLTLLEDLIDSQMPNLRICVTSRPEADIKPVLEPLTFRSVSLHDESGQQEDIENYIKWVVNTNRNMRRWTPEHKELVIDILTNRAQGMYETYTIILHGSYPSLRDRFRWVYCQLDYLGDCLPGRVRHALDELPPTLDATYERTLREIKETNWEFARRLLMCVAVASRPLLVEELADFLAFDFKAGPVPKFREDWRLEDPVDAVLSTCPTFLSLVSLRNSQVIQFSHFSVREFLMSARLAETPDSTSRRYHISTTPAHTLVTQACLGILFHLDKNVTRDSLSNFPLVKYASEHWFKHARFDGVSQNSDEGIKQLFDRRKPHLSIWLWIYNPTAPSWERKSAKGPSPPRGTPLHYAAFFGLHDAIELLAIADSQDLNSQSFYQNSTPLHLVAREGHVKVARFLVKRGADMEARDSSGRTPLHKVSEWGHVELARLLVEHAAIAAVQDLSGRTPLHLASEGGHVELARLLVENGANVTVQDSNGRTPMHWVSDRGHAEPARLLIEHGADVTAQDSDRLAPLHWASLRDDVELARLLVEHGADMSAQDSDRRTPLHWASLRGYVELARLLVEHGADMAARDVDGRTPLHRASEGGHLKLAQLLVEHGADMAAQDADGWTPLHRASSWAHVKLVQFLIERGADAAARDSNGRTPLHRATERNHVSLARLLIEHGVDIEAQDSYGRRPLHWVSDRVDVEFARLLVEHGADVAARDREGWTPLHWASGHGRVKLALFLIEHGADVAARDANGRTPLHRAAPGGHVELARLLIENGADIEAQNLDGWRPLHWVSDWVEMEFARLLIEHGADVSAQDAKVLTPLHWASDRGRVKPTLLLIEHGADVAARDVEGWTPLHRASKWGRLQVARLLIEHGADVLARVVKGLTPLHWASD